MPRIHPNRTKSAGFTCRPRSAVRSYPRRRAACIARRSGGEPTCLEIAGYGKLAAPALVEIWSRDEALLTLGLMRDLDLAGVFDRPVHSSQHS